MEWFLLLEEEFLNNVEYSHSCTMLMSSKKEIHFDSVFVII